jgi:hypothetical protein
MIGAFAPKACRGLLPLPRIGRLSPLGGWAGPVQQMGAESFQFAGIPEINQFVFFGLKHRDFGMTPIRDE